LKISDFGIFYSSLILQELNNDLEILNVGHNCLTDSWLRGLKEPLKHNTGLSRLGLQSTKITSVSAAELASVFEHNKTLHVSLKIHHCDLYFTLLFKFPEGRLARQSTEGCWSPEFVEWSISKRKYDTAGFGSNSSLPG
jgi:hypothetical protein